MEKNRIGKLLLSEYKDISDIIIIESPFAETTRDGCGVREVALALTPTKLIIATDIFRNNNQFLYPSDLDPSIETLELVAIYPLKFMTLSIFHRKQRKTLKTRLIDGRVNYFELGGMNKRDACWNLWCDNIHHLLYEKRSGSSLTETTAGSSSSMSTLDFLSSDTEQKNKHQKIVQGRCICRQWKHQDGTGNNFLPSWTKKDTYMGPAHSELCPKIYSPVPINFSKLDVDDWKEKIQLQQTEFSNELKLKYCDCKQNIGDILFTTQQNYQTYLKNCDGMNSINTSKNQLKTSSHGSRSSQIPKLSRFSFGIDEKCATGLCLSSHEEKQDDLELEEHLQPSIDSYKIIESGVEIWEKNASQRKNVRNVKISKITPAPHFLFALGPWKVHDGDRISIQSKRSISSVNIQKQPVDNELKLSISKKQLTMSVSMPSLEDGILPSMSGNCGRILLFWTPNYWYRPRGHIASYQDLRKHLEYLREFQQTIKKRNNRNLFSRRIRNKYHADDNSTKTTSCDVVTCALTRILSSKYVKKEKNEIGRKKRSGTTEKLKSLLRMDLKITTWDLDSTTIAKQLTLIDRDLFLRISTTEVKMIIYEKSSKNATNIEAFVAFSHRVSCLVANEILAIGNLHMRVRIISRFINAAYKCFHIGNFQSCKSIIAGLQSPAIYRLKSSWMHLKTHHATSYESFSKLCKIFKNVRRKIYVNAWMKAELRPPLIPHIGDIFIRILGLDTSSVSLFCECPIQEIERKSLKEQLNWKGDSTFLSQFSEPKLKETNQIEHNDNSVTKPILKKENNIVKKLFMKLRYGNYQPIKPMKKDIFWAANRLILTRKYFEYWRMFVITGKIISENKSQKRINAKKKKMEKVIMWLLTCQRHARLYDFPGHSLAWEFLLKARYRDEKESFSLSRKLEPLLD